MMILLILVEVYRVYDPNHESCWTVLAYSVYLWLQSSKLTSVQLLSYCSPELYSEWNFIQDGVKVLDSNDLLEAVMKNNESVDKLDQAIKAYMDKLPTITDKKDLSDYCDEETEVVNQKMVSKVSPETKDAVGNAGLLILGLILDDFAEHSISAG